MQSNNHWSIKNVVSIAIFIGFIGFCGCARVANPLTGEQSVAIEKGVRLIMAKDIPGSEREFAAIISKRRDDIEVYEVISAAYLKFGHPDLAVKYASLGLSAAPTAQDLHKCNLLSIRCEAHLELGERQKAVDDAQSAYDLQRDNPILENGLGYAMAEASDPIDPVTPDRLKKAETLINSAIEKLKKADSPAEQLGVVIDSLGWVHFKMGKIKEAELELFRATELAPEQGEIYYHLGIVLMRANKTDQAQNALSKAKRLNPTLIMPELRQKSLP